MECRNGVAINITSHCKGGKRMMSDALKNLNVLLLLLAIFLETSQACPSLCVCKWKNGKQTVECDDKNLLTIPEGMDPGTQVLEFSGNNLRTLHKEKFLKMDLINLQRIYLSRCRISVIDDRTFKGLTNLVELDLSNNLLEIIPTGTFIDCPSLMRLTLSFNPIKALKPNAFNHLSFLNTLELSNCEIERVDEGAFQELHSLEWLQLDGNKLKTLNANKVLPESLKGVDLQGNAWECDCQMVELRNWLRDFNIPHTVQPVCFGPSNLKNRPIKSVEINDLACLPDVSPTGFYLEIGEGENITLLCQIHAIPEARVTWRFHGQILQNDTIIGPGMRLLYFVEDGEKDKHSKLFIYNTNVEDNGTYVCSAENPAGISRSNFSIRIIVKKEPIVIIVSFPFEYLLAVVAGAAVLVLVLIIAVIASIVRCRRNRRRQQKREKTKEVALQYQQNNTKCAVIRENADCFTESLKENAIEADRRQQEMMFYNAHPSEELLRAMSPVAVANQVRSPASSLRRYQLEQNPDLINDTESVGRRREGDGEDEPNCETGEDEQINPIIHPAGLVQFPINCARGNRKLYNVNSWDPGYSAESDGYPMDYGLPKLQTSQSNESYYRTLPYSRVCKRPSAANPSSRFSREAEFLSRSTQPASYEHYCPDVRYTADGYPARSSDLSPALLPSPPEGYKCDRTDPLPCCSAAPWQACAPANMHVISPNIECNQSKFANVSKRCVGAQTDTECNKSRSPDKTEPSANIRDESVNNDAPTESPDEGYEGEPTVV